MRVLIPVLIGALAQRLRIGYCGLGPGFETRKSIYALCVLGEVILQSFENLCRMDEWAIGAFEVQEVPILERGVGYGQKQAGSRSTFDHFS